MTETNAIWGWAATLDPRIWQAVVAGGFVALGWVFNGWRARREAASIRAERLRDVHRALYAEIGANLATLGSADLIGKRGGEVIEKIKSAPDYHPFIFHENNDVVYRAIVADIHVLPRTSIDAVVAYYAQLAAISALVEDFRGPTVKALPSDRRVAIYADYIAMRQQAVAFGTHALTMINAYAKGGKEGALAVEKQLSSLRDAGRFDP